MNDGKRNSFLERTLRNLRGVWQGIAGLEYDADSASMRPDLPAEDAKRLRAQMETCLEERGGEVSARARAAALGHVYLALDATGRERFLRLLAEEFDVDHAAVAAAVHALNEADDDSAFRAAERKLYKTLEAPRIKLLTRFNALPEGVKFLVDMRAELLNLAGKDPVLRDLEQDLKTLLSTWFDVDFLELRQITWDSASGALLERLMAYEAVHAIESWDDLKNRLASDRRCFAYFHPCMPDEPLIFVEVALVTGMSGSIQTLLDEDAPIEDPKGADTAIFYSISNAQKGLAGISFGNFLIKRVVDTLAKELPGLKTFATLSPIPAFRAWLDSVLAKGEVKLLLPAERKALRAVADGSGGAKGILKGLLASDDWPSDEAAAQALRAPLLRLCARYLVEEKADGKRIADPVGHFHLSNGARMERLNWLSDRSPRGLGQSAGIMINYLYKLNEIDANHEDYITSGGVAVSSAVRGLAKS